ncbi:MAG: MFS transporter [Gammaproteobacteria bacterium]|nr:MFS transporter [Gammaproteobacteria bacterium]
MNHYPNRFLHWSIVVCIYTIGFFLRVSLGALQDLFRIEFQCDYTQIGSLSFIFYLCYAVFQFIGAYISKKIAIDKMFILFNSILILGLLIFISADSFHLLFLGRAMMGMGSSLNFLYAVVCTRSFFSSTQVPLYIAILNACGICGAVFAQYPLELGLTIYSWHILLLIPAFTLTFCYILFFIVKTTLPKPLAHIDMDNTQHDRVVEKFDLSEIKLLLKWSLIAQIMMLHTITIPQLWGILYIEHVHMFSNVLSAAISTAFFIGGGFGGIVTSSFFQDRKIIKKLSSFMILQSLSLLLFLMPLGHSHSSLAFFAFISSFFGSGMLIFFTLISARYANPAVPLAFFNMSISIGPAVIQPIIGYLLDILTPIFGLSHALLWVFFLLPCTLLLAAVMLRIRGHNLL